MGKVPAQGLVPLQQYDVEGINRPDGDAKINQPSDFPWIWHCPEGLEGSSSDAVWQRRCGAQDSSSHSRILECSNPLNGNTLRCIYVALTETWQLLCKRMLDFTSAT